MNNRKSTPSLVERLLRQEAGFGCVKCGHPIYQYHHIIPYRIEPHFREEDMTIFCPNHHDEASRGVMSQDEQRSYKSNPYNIQRGFVDGQFKLNQKELEISAGGIIFSNTEKVLAVDDESLLSVFLNENNIVEISLKLYDENDNVLLIIDKNQWESGDSRIWDLEYKYNFLKIQRKSRDITLKLDARTNPVEIIRADFWRKKQHYRINKCGLIFNGVVTDSELIICSFNKCYINVDTKKKRLELGKSSEITPV